jgi:ubiquinone/menaquinone biosynthesis C-methylase UbiE
MMGDSQRLQATWESWANTDPLFAILSDPEKLGRGWDVAEFMAHTPELDSALATVRRRRLGRGRSVALDFGCGVGRITQALADHFERVVGVDISDTMISQARGLNQHGDRCQYFSGDLSRFPDATFDMVFCLYVIQHIPRSMQSDILREFVRVVKPEGLIVCQIPAPPHGIAGLRRKLVPRWLSELKFRLSYRNAPLIEMNPLPDSTVKRWVEPAQVVAKEDEWFFIQRTRQQRAQVAA